MTAEMTGVAVYAFALGFALGITVAMTIYFWPTRKTPKTRKDSVS